MMRSKSKVSGHSGLPENVELRIMAENAERAKSRKKERYQAMLNLMNSMGIAPMERRTFIISFAKWLEQEGKR